MDTPSLHHYPIKSISVPIRYEKDDYIHVCRQLVNENRVRQLEGDSPIFMFKDESSWYMKIGSEFVKMNVCPFCTKAL